MSYKQKNLSEHFNNDGQPKRILTLDGGGLRGILTVGMLQKIEDILRLRHGGSEEFRLSDYFDLIAGTSTGAIIAAALAQGWSVDRIRSKYMELGKQVFEKSLFRQGLFRAKYDQDKLINELKDVYGADTTLSSNNLKTGLLVITKRLDTGSPWPISNNPKGKYYVTRPNGSIGNGDYPLWQVVRASTAAPAFFDPETITIVDKPGHESVEGNFVDGGVSPYNNPALQAMMYATMDGYNIGWPSGANNLLLVSLGTGTADPEVKTSGFTASHAIKSLMSLMDDCAEMQEIMLQWMSSSATAKTIDRELGDLRHDLVSGMPLLSYLRYNVDLRKESVQNLLADLTDEEQIKSLSNMDAPENMLTLHELGKAAADQAINSIDFASNFDLPNS